MNERESLISQYHAVLEMLRQAIIACPDSLWLGSGDRTPFWQVAYHALFYTHLYLQEAQETFSHWSGHREAYLTDGAAQTVRAEPATKADVLAYLTFCQQQVVEHVPALVFGAASGFPWLPFSKFELQLYTIRHIQQHVGELMERLGTLGIDIDWVGSYRANTDT